MEMGANLPTHLSVLCHIGFDHDGVGAFGECLEHRHGGLYPTNARDVASGGDDPTFLTADNDWFPA